MIHEDTEVIFPPRVIPTLKQLRGSNWQILIEEVEHLPKDDPERLAFVLMMTRICGCVTCHADSFRAMRGCTQCSYQAIRRYREPDDQLLEEFETAKREIADKVNLSPNKG
jgi:hypothetical protein